MKRRTAAKLLDWDSQPLFSPHSFKIHHFHFAPKTAVLVPKAFCTGQDRFFSAGMVKRDLSDLKQSLPSEKWSQLAKKITTQIENLYLHGRLLGWKPSAMADMLPPNLDCPRLFLPMEHFLSSTMLLQRRAASGEITYSQWVHWRESVCGCITLNR